MESTTLKKVEGTELWVAQDGYVYNRSDAGLFFVQETAKPKKSKFKRILEIIREKQ